MCILGSAFHIICFKVICILFYACSKYLFVITWWNSVCFSHIQFLLYITLASYTCCGFRHDHFVFRCVAECVTKQGITVILKNCYLKLKTDEYAWKLLILRHFLKNVHERGVKKSLYFKTSKWISELLEVMCSSGVITR